MIALGALVLIGAGLGTAVMTAKSNKKETVADVEIGECFTGDANDVKTVACDEPHQFELFAVAAAPDPNVEFPGAETVTTDGGSACVMALVEYYGATVDVAAADGLEVVPVAPTEAQWQDGDTDTFCLGADAEGAALDQSIKGQGAG
jgi:hypothetical protein